MPDGEAHRMTDIDGYEMLGGPGAWNRGDLRTASRAFNSLSYGDERKIGELPNILNEVFRLLSGPEEPTGCGTCRHRTTTATWNSLQFPGLTLLIAICGHSNVYVDAHGLAAMRCADFTPEAGDDPEPFLQRNSSRAERWR